MPHLPIEKQAALAFKDFHIGSCCDGSITESEDVVTNAIISLVPRLRSWCLVLRS